MDRSQFLKYLSCLVLFIYASATYAQQTSNQDTVDNFLKTEKVDVIKSFEAQLTDALMLPLKPRPPEINTVARDYLYKVTIIPYDIQSPDPVIRPLAMNRDAPDKTYSSSIKVGYGNINNLFTDMKFHKSIADINDWNLNLQYERVDNSENVNNQKYSTFYGSTHLGIPVLETAKVDLSINGSNDRRYFYYDGTDLENSFSEEEALREIGKFGGKVTFYNTHENINNIDFKVSMVGNYTNLSDIDENEFYGLVEGTISKYSGEYLSFTLSGGGDLNSSFGNNDLIGYFNPYIKFSKSNINFSGGINYVYANDESYLFPYVFAHYALSQSALQVFAGAEQQFLRNNMHITTQYNPFTIGFRTSATTVTRDLYIGFKGKIQTLEYTLKWGLKDLNDQIYFNTDFQDSLRRIRMFNTDLQSVYIAASLNLEVGNKAVVGGSITQQFFKELTIDELWHIPSLEMNVFGQYKLLNDKLKLRSDLFLRNSAKVDTPDGIKNLENMIDLNLEVEFLPIENFGVYIKGKNLLDKGYRRWYSYPTLGIHMEGGILFRF